MGSDLDTTRGRVMKRFDRASLWFILSLLSFSLIAIGHSWYRASLPSDGWTFPYEFDQGFQQYIFDEFYGNGVTPLRSGDILVAIEGHPVEQLVGAAIGLRPQRSSNWEVGQIVGYTVLREGREVDLDVALIRREPALIFAGILETLFLIQPGSLPQLLIAIYIFYRRPRNLAAQLLMVYTTVFFLTVIFGDAVTGENTGTAELFFPLAYWPGMFFSLLTFPLIIVPTTGYLFLNFPIEKGLVKAYPRIAALLIYTIAPLVLIIGFYNSYSHSLTFWISVLQAGAPFLFPLFTITAILSLVHTMTSSGTAILKAQSRWLLIGVFVGIVLGNGMIFFLIELGIIHASLSLTILQAVLGMAFPISLLIVILKYKLWEIDIIINKSLVYGTMTLLLAAIFGGSLFLISQQIQELAGGGLVAFGVSAAVFGVIFQPARYRLQRFVDQRFYNIQID